MHKKDHGALCRTKSLLVRESAHACTLSSAKKVLYTILLQQCIF